MRALFLLWAISLALCSAVAAAEPAISKEKAIDIAEAKLKEYLQDAPDASAVKFQEAVTLGEGTNIDKWRVAFGPTCENHGCCKLYVIHIDAATGEVVKQNLYRTSTEISGTTEVMETARCE